MALPPRIRKEPKRDSRWRSTAHLNFVRSFQCAVPGCHGRPIEAAHVRIGSGAGMGQKPHDYYAVPLCKGCHARQHIKGEDTFWRTYHAASGQTVEQLIDALCKESPKAAEIRKRRNGQ